MQFIANVFAVTAFNAVVRITRRIDGIHIWALTKEAIGIASSRSSSIIVKSNPHNSTIEGTVQSQNSNIVNFVGRNIIGCGRIAAIRDS